VQVFDVAAIEAKIEDLIKNKSEEEKDGGGRKR
jgi:low affinity Fe/Cu permease